MTMNLIRRILLLLLMLTTICASCSLSYADTADSYNLAAEELYSIGLFKGGDNGFDLGSQPTRVQAAVMVVRFIGEESSVLSGESVYAHPFNDVPDWASSYVGYMYNKDITKGNSINTFGSDDIIDANSFTAFMLRAMGYSDTNGDFNTSQALEYAASINMLSQNDVTEMRQSTFTRGTMVYIARRSLDANMKGYNVSLMEYLDGKGALIKTYANVNEGILEDGVLNSEVFIETPSLGQAVQNENKTEIVGGSTLDGNVILADSELGLSDEEIIDGDSIINDTEVVIENPTLDDVNFSAMDSATATARSNLIKKAYEQLGIKYTSGGKSPTTGFDCSGFVGYSMIKSGVWDKFYGSCMGLYTQCTPISLSEAEPGDLVFFQNTYSTSNRFSHVGIYLGDNKMIHSGSSTGVAVVSFASGYWADHYACVARPNSFIK